MLARPTGLTLSRLIQGLLFLIAYTFLVVYIVQTSFPIDGKCSEPTEKPQKPTKCPECPAPTILENKQVKCPPQKECPKCPDSPPDHPATDCAIACPVNCEVSCSGQVATKKPETKVDIYYDGPYEYQIDDAYRHMLNLIKTHTIDCPDVRFLGFHGQGGDANRPEGTWPVCWHEFKNCKVLTFGVSDDPGFENHLAKISGCQIWAHDPTVTGYGLRLEPNVTFVKLGLSGINADPPQSQWPVRTLSTLMERVQIESLPILKVDIEGAEWSFLREAIDSGAIKKVGQLMVEVHFWPHLLPGATSNHEMVRTWYRILKDLTDAGFQVFDYHENPFSTYPVDLFTRGPAACCHELGFININYDHTGFYKKKK